MNCTIEDMLAAFAGKATQGHPENTSSWPSSCKPIADDIISTFNELTSGTEQLADELLNCYEALNAAFEAVTSVAMCTNTDEAVKVLTKEIGKVVGSSVAYYIGVLPGVKNKNRLPDDKPLCEKILHKIEITPTQASSRDFLEQHNSEITQLMDNTDVFNVALIGYADEHKKHHDYEGRGNVLVIKLSGADEKDNWAGHLICLRSVDQKLFTALDVNLAMSTSKTGAAVLDNIIYAEKLNRAYLQTVTSLVRTIEAKDKYTSGHSTRVSAIAKELGQIVGLESRKLRWIEQAGLLHDIGKIGIRDYVLCKTGKLTDKEFAEIKTHPKRSYKVLEPIEAMKPALLAVKHHHEHFDGTGYPDGLVGQAIPFEARILQIADVWDALTSTRSYRKALSKEKAIAIMCDEAGTVLDSEIFAKFKEAFDSGKISAANRDTTQNQQSKRSKSLQK